MKETHFTQNCPFGDRIGHFARIGCLSNLVRQRADRGGGIRKDQICDLSHTSCNTRLGDKPLTVRVVSLPVQAERDFVIQLQGGDPVTPVKAWLEGRDMFMGTIPVNFEATEQGWQGTTLVGSCTSPLMVWLLNIEWSNGQRQQLALSVAR